MLITEDKRVLDIIFRDLHTSLHFSFRSSQSDSYHSLSSEMSLNWKNLFLFTEPFVLVLFASLIVGGCANVGWSLVHVAPGCGMVLMLFVHQKLVWKYLLTGAFVLFFRRSLRFLAPEYTIFKVMGFI